MQCFEKKSSSIMPTSEIWRHLWHPKRQFLTILSQFEHIMTPLTPLKYFKPHKSVYILVHISKRNNLKVNFFHIFAFFGSYDPFLHQNDVILTRFDQFEHILTHLTPLKYFKPHKSVYILVQISKGNNLKVKLFHCFLY